VNTILYLYTFCLWRPI